MYQALLGSMEGVSVLPYTGSLWLNPDSLAQHFRAFLG